MLLSSPWNSETPVTQRNQGQTITPDASEDPGKLEPTSEFMNQQLSPGVLDKSYSFLWEKIVLLMFNYFKDLYIC